MTDTRYKFNGTTVRLPSGDVLVGAGAKAPELLDSLDRAVVVLVDDTPAGGHLLLVHVEASASCIQDFH